MPTLATKRVMPHTRRHSVGVQLVAAGVDVTLIRNWLGTLDWTITTREPTWRPSEKR
jgi:site-specific recombinase XerD